MIYDEIVKKEYNNNILKKQGQTVNRSKLIHRYGKTNKQIDKNTVRQRNMKKVCKKTQYQYLGLKRDIFKKVVDHKI